MPVTHELKTQWQYFDAVVAGEKTFEVRKDDRGFQKGDILELHCTDERGQRLYRGEQSRYPRCKCEITYIYTGGLGGLQPGYVVLGLKLLEGPK